jgi:aspartyl-tRNA synthetase
MAILGESSVREVIAFPATAGGQTAVMDAPSSPSQEQISELHIKASK